MNPLDRTTPHTPTWREIPQQVKPRAMSAEGRKRLLIRGCKTAALCVAVAIVAWGGWTIATLVQDNPRKISRTVATVPVKDVVLMTDGVLDQAWLLKTLALPKKATLLDLDLYQLRGRLMASGQVATASLTRNFPSTLTVVLSERSPVARVMAQLGTDAPQPFLVARDGTVFGGLRFDQGMVDTLPWLAGVKLVKQGDGFAPIAGMDQVAQLLARAKLDAEHLYRTWKIVSLARLATDNELEVQSADIPKIVFSTQEDFFVQLARLDSLIDTARAHTDQPMSQINLAIGAEVPVVFSAADTVAASNPPAAKPSSASFVLPSFTPTTSRPTKREL